MLEYKGILNKEQDMAGKWRILVDATDETINLKFQTEPTETDVISVVGPIINRRNAELSAEFELKPVTEDIIARRNELENDYLKCTQDLIYIATDEVVPIGTKLEDLEYRETAKKAIVKDATSTFFLLHSLQYTFFQIKLLGFAWEDISWHPE